MTHEGALLLAADQPPPLLRCLREYVLVIRANRYSAHVRIRPERLLYDAEHDLLATAECLYSLTHCECLVIAAAT